LAEGQASGGDEHLLLANTVRITCAWNEGCSKSGYPSFNFPASPEKRAAVIQPLSLLRNPAKRGSVSSFSDLRYQYTCYLFSS